MVRQVTTLSPSKPDPWRDDRIKEAQKEDPDIKPILELKESSSVQPSWQDISIYSPTDKRYCALWDSFHGMLYLNGSLVMYTA